MLYQNFFLAIRYLAKNKTITSLNFVGLTVSLAVALLIGLMVRKESLTDSFVQQPEQVYRVIRTSAIDDKSYEIGITSPNFAPALQADLGENMQESTRFYLDEIFISVDEKRFNEKKFAYVDANFFQFFNLELLYGDVTTALSKPESVVLTIPTAIKLFGSPEVAMGKTIRWNNEQNLEITGIFAGFPANSHLEFDYLAALDKFKNEGWFGNWWNNCLCTYVKLAPGVSAASVNAQFPGFIDKYFGEDFAKQGGRIDLKLQPLSEVYWNADIRHDPARHGNRQATAIFAFSALLLVVIACFNFINLSTAQAAERSKEVGVRKALGAGRAALSGQFLLESSLLVTASVIAGSTMAALELPYFNSVFELDLKLSDLSMLETAAWLTGLMAFIILAAGFYPAVLLSSFRSATVLKQKARLSSGAIQLRQVLTVVQFSLSVTLIISTLVVYQQLEFIKNTDLGFQRENVVVIETYGTEVRREKLFTYRQQIARYPGVLGQSVADAAPGNSPDASIIEIAGRTDRPKINVMYADFEFAQTIGVPLLAGRDFDAKFATDSTAMLINESACRTLGVTPNQAIGMEIRPVQFDALPHRVIGVLKDYHFLSLREKIAPLLIMSNYRYPGTLAVRVAAGSLPHTLKQLQNDWVQIDPAHPFEYRMLDDQLARLYQSEEKQGKLFGFFALTAIFIASLGMFGLATLLAGQRTKEIGIRKVLGASMSGITTLLAKDFLKLVVAAILVASPIAYYFMQKWLSDFAYRIDMEWWMFAAAGGGALAVALITVSYQSVRAALVNPVESLRSE